MGKEGQRKYWFLKRTLDIVLAVVVCLFSWPLAGVVWVMGLLLFRGRPMFRQQRIGYREEPFMLWKFRSMTEARDTEGNYLPDTARLTTWGAFLRRSRMDEWPQLFLIMRGTMSWVGPRPLLPSYLSLYTSQERKRHGVLPGITGLAQVRGGNALPWEQRLAYDAEYANTSSLRLDLFLLFFTLFRSGKLLSSPALSDPLEHHRVG